MPDDIPQMSVPDIAPQPTQAREDVHYDPSMFGAGLGQAISSVGHEALQMAVREAQWGRQIASQQLQNGGYDQMSQAYEEFRTADNSTGEQLHKNAEKYRQRIGEINQETLDGAPDDKSRAMLSRGMGYHVRHFTSAINQFEYTTSHTQDLNATTGVSDKASETLQRDPTQYPIIKDQIAQTWRDYAARNAKPSDWADDKIQTEMDKALKLTTRGLLMKEANGEMDAHQVHAWFEEHNDEMKDDSTKKTLGDAIGKALFVQQVNGVVGKAIQGEGSDVAPQDQALAYVDNYTKEGKERDAAYAEVNKFYVQKKEKDTIAQNALWKDMADDYQSDGTVDPLKEAQFLQYDPRNAKRWASFKNSVDSMATEKIPDHTAPALYVHHLLRMAEGGDPDALQEVQNNLDLKQYDGRISKKDSDKAWDMYEKCMGTKPKDVGNPEIHEEQYIDMARQQAGLKPLKDKEGVYNTDTADFHREVGQAIQALGPKPSQSAVTQTVDNFTKNWIESNKMIQAHPNLIKGRTTEAQLKELPKGWELRTRIEHPTWNDQDVIRAYLEEQIDAPANKPFNPTSDYPFFGH